MQSVPAASPLSSDLHSPLRTTAEVLTRNSSAESLPPWRVLSLDGGGVRGLAELLILEKIFGALTRILCERGEIAQDSEELLPCDFFDLIGGTSTGGLIALMLGRLRMKISVAIDRFRQISEAAFPADRKRWRSLKVIMGGTLYDDEAFIKQIKQIVKHNQSNEDLELIETPEPKCRVFVCTTTNHTSSTRLLRSYTPRDPSHSFPSVKIWEAARATSAAPLLFKPMTIQRPGSSMTFYDGGLTDNNPIKQAISECGDLDPTRELGCVVSLGTGVKTTQPLNGSSHLFSVAKSLINLSLNCHLAHLDFSETNEGRSLIRSQRYFRFSVEQNLNQVKIDEWESFNAIVEYVDHYAREKRYEIEKCAETLLNSRTGSFISGGVGTDDPRSSTYAPPVTLRQSFGARLASVHPILSSRRASVHVVGAHTDVRQADLANATTSYVSLPTSFPPNDRTGRPTAARDARNVLESRPTVQAPTASELTFTISPDQRSRLTPGEADMEEIANEVKLAESFLQEGSLTQAYSKFRAALKLLSSVPAVHPSRLHCHAHLGMSQCRMLAADGKQRETALKYLEVANKHALNAYDFAPEASRPATQLNLLAIAIMMAEKKAIPDGMERQQVAIFLQRTDELINSMRRMENGLDDAAQTGRYSGLLARAEEWKRKLAELR